jgi:hypothetical protein
MIGTKYIIDKRTSEDNQHIIAYDHNDYCFLFLVIFWNKVMRLPAELLIPLIPLLANCESTIM